MFFATNKIQKKTERACHGLHHEGIKTLQDNGIFVLALDDEPGWMLMRKASLTQERRERLIAALLDEHFRINDVNCTSASPVSLMGRRDGQKRAAYQRRENAPASIPQCSRDW